MSVERQLLELLVRPTAAHQNGSSLGLWTAICPRSWNAISHGSTRRLISEGSESDASTPAREQTPTSSATSATRLLLAERGLLGPRRNSPLTEDLWRSWLGAWLKHWPESDDRRVLSSPAGYETRGWSVPAEKFRRVRTQSLGRVPLVGEDKAESPGFVRRFDEKMELADIEIAAWRGDISSASSVVPLIVQTKKGRCPWYDRTPLIRTLVA